MISRTGIHAIRALVCLGHLEPGEESKHGILYRANREKLKLDQDVWRAGREYFSGPTCSSCHMSAAGDEKVTHDVGERTSRKAIAGTATG